MCGEAEKCSFIPHTLAFLPHLPRLREQAATSTKIDALPVFPTRTRNLEIRECLAKRARSTGRCNTGVKSFGGRLVVQCFLGRSLRRRAILLSSAWECGAKSVPRGKYLRRSRLVFSFDPRCHGFYGAQK
jgi:hypothetical protein